MWKFIRYILLVVIMFFFAVIITMAITPDDDVNGERMVLITSATKLINLSAMEGAMETAALRDAAVLRDSPSAKGVLTVDREAFKKCLIIASGRRIMNESAMLKVIDNCVASLPKVDFDTRLPE